MSLNVQYEGSRRTHLRHEMSANIRRCAYEQLAAGGAESLSMNAIAKKLGVSGPALYRYYASREELLAELVTESWEELAARMEETAAGASRLSAAERFRAEAQAYRRWALDSPHRYRLLNGSRFGTGALDPERIVPAAHRTMIVVLGALVEVSSPRGLRPPLTPELSAQLLAWATSRRPDSSVPPEVLLRGLLAQTRIHGVVSLEIEGYFDQLGIDADLLFDHEVDALLA
uniref:Putative TetR transcriptional regulator n=1 Tax=Arthrobacter globiformis TaxID=1665 RepID=B8R4M2_ARTGO|nr:putative TetR transcriptional regulator [Arthrobacter globiformis]